MRLTLLFLPADNLFEEVACLSAAPAGSPFRHILGAMGWLMIAPLFIRSLRHAARPEKSGSKGTYLRNLLLTPCFGGGGTLETRQRAA
jgi:hypothetical protein